jgi:HlyD family secretion protein
VRRRLAIVAVGLAALAALVVWLRRDGGETYYTGFVEGEERVLRSEVSGRVLEVAFREGDRVPRGAVVARIDESEIAARVLSKRQELAVLDAEIERQAQQVELVASTWEKDVSAREAELRQAESAAQLAARNLKRERSLMAERVSTAQRLDERRAQHDQSSSALQRARDVLARTRAEERSIAVARRELDVMRERHALAAAQLAELEVAQAKHAIRAPDVDTVVQFQLVWPGELAQPGTPVASVLDPRDKYVQIYVPVSDVTRLRVGARVAIELDSQPGQRVPGEVSFVADEANFTPERIETRSDRVGQVYRAKVRILEDVERFQPGTEGNVYLVESPPPVAQEQAAQQEP